MIQNSRKRNEKKKNERKRKKGIIKHHKKNFQDLKEHNNHPVQEVEKIHTKARQE